MEYVAYTPRLDAERAKKRRCAWSGIGKVVFAANDVRNLHFQVIYHVDKMEKTGWPSDRMMTK